MDQLDPIPLEQSRISPKRGHGGPRVWAYLMAAVLLAGLQLALLMRVNDLDHRAESLQQQLDVNTHEIGRLGGRINTVEAELGDGDSSMR